MQLARSAIVIQLYFSLMSVEMTTQKNKGQFNKSRGPYTQ